jgi:hypothetical protein
MQTKNFLSTFKKLIKKSQLQSRESDANNPANNISSALTTISFSSERKKLTTFFPNYLSNSSTSKAS